MTILKKTKIFFFAALLVAMILPFSGMDFANAAPNENANDKAKDNEKKKTHKEWIDEGYKVLPGGHYVKNTQKGVDKDKSIDENAKNGIDRDILKKDNHGKTIIDLDKYMEKQAKQKSNNKKVKDTTTNFPADGYNTIIAKSENDAMSYFRAVWDVPSDPVSYDTGDTIFTFNAIQPFGTSSSVIMQPVLQYGSNGPCPNSHEGEFWVYYPFIYASPTAYNIGDCTTVEVGDELKGYVYKSGSTWYVTTYINGVYDSSVSTGYNGYADFASIALETYGLPQNCNSIPGDEEFSSIYIVGDSVAWSDLSSSGAGQWCGMTTYVENSDTSGSGVIQLNNNN